MEKVRIILLIISCCLFLFCLFILFRNSYTYKCMSIASDCISSYCDDLLARKEYNTSINYYMLYKYDYNKYMFNIKLWGRYSAIKPEYIDILKKYDNKIV